MTWHKLTLDKSKPTNVGYNFSLWESLHCAHHLVFSEFVFTVSHQTFLQNHKIALFDLLCCLQWMYPHYYRDNWLTIEPFPMHAQQNADMLLDESILSSQFTILNTFNLCILPFWSHHILNTDFSAVNRADLVTLKLLLQLRSFTSFYAMESLFFKSHILGSVIDITQIWHPSRTTSLLGVSDV